MNERIFDMARQSGATDEQGSLAEHIFCFTKSELSAFAELLIRECVKEIEFQYGGGSDQPMDNEWDRAIECVSSMVKYRFGVEE